MLAEVFGRKPTIVSLEDYSEIRHEGTSAGFLYIIDEHLSPADVNPHSNSSMKRGLEWVTNRPLKVTRLVKL
ncbi:MAG: hypothetical protein CMQ33_01060 [Gammaproteobacteria bacterium]|nr:hypothetical protein [Gammaproteobacteria bacterium]